MPSTIAASKLEAVIRVLLSADTEEDLVEAKKQAAKINAMSDEEIQSLMDEGEGDPEEEQEQEWKQEGGQALPRQFMRGDFLDCFR
jgi:hypothetical protein